MSNTCQSCEERRASLPFNIYIPTRGQATTSHPDDSPKTIVGFELPGADDLEQNLLITVTSRNSDGSIKLAAQIHALVSRRAADTPDYRVDKGGSFLMNADDLDIEFDLVANGDINATLTITDTSGDFVGDITHNFQIWVLDELKL